MKHETRDELIALVKERATNIYDIVDLIIGLESLYDFRASLIIRNDVESEFQYAWEFNGRQGRKMTDEEWEKFRSEWFWRKGHSEIMWDGVTDAIRWDLRELDLVPKDIVI
jgi:hypothetical protein